MIELTKEQFGELKHWFSKDCPGYLVGQHVLQTGHGSGWVDQWPSPRALIVSALCSDIQARGHQAIWTTGAEMAASIRVAEKLGFTFQRDDVLYVTEAEMQQQD